MTSLAVSQPQSSSSHRDSNIDIDNDDDKDISFSCVDFNGVDFGDECEYEASARPDGSMRGITNASREITQRNNIMNKLPYYAVADSVYESADNEVHESSGGAGAFKSTVTQTLEDFNKNESSSSIIDRKQAFSFISIDPDPKYQLTAIIKRILSLEKAVLVPHQQEDTSLDLNCLGETEDDCVDFKHLLSLCLLLNEGKYVEILKSPLALELLDSENGSEVIVRDQLLSYEETSPPSMMELVKWRILNYFSSEYTAEPSHNVLAKCLELELIAVASLNLFLQLNYTGPSMDKGMKPEEEKNTLHPLDGINPHGMFRNMAKEFDPQINVNNDYSHQSASLGLGSKVSDLPARLEVTSIYSLKETSTNDCFHNHVLTELSCDGEWPFQICRVPYFLLLARSILSVLSEPTRPFRIWIKEDKVQQDLTNDEKQSIIRLSSSIGVFVAASMSLCGSVLWNARALVAHRRLITVRRDDDDGEACPTLWKETEEMFSRCISLFCQEGNNCRNESDNAHIGGSIMLEWGLAQHHFRKAGRGKSSFHKALSFTKLKVEVTGAEGKRTKYQKKTTAQYLVRAKPADSTFLLGSKNLESEEKEVESRKDANAYIGAQMIKHDDVTDDALLLEKIQFEEESDNVHYTLSILDQSILLALCLDVKNDNPMDGLTGEQMGGYLARVLNQHDDWMVYATALLERAWLECERTHGRERAILQIQALADQHSNRLTLTQSTFKSVEEDSAPVFERLRNLHGIVYPPRWDMLRDLAERYAKLGVVTSAAEIFEELELWDEVVECYRIAGKESKAEEVVKRRLAEKETPKMLVALGNLIKDPKCFERSLQLSRGKFYDAHVSLGKYSYDNDDLFAAQKHYLNALHIKPLMPAVWFRVGTISMQLQDWDAALNAFTEVVQQEPEEGDAWANVAAIHMYRKRPAEAYPALLESLKQNRSNWRVWLGKLYTCIDLKRYDEAIQACVELLDLKMKRNSSEGIPMLEEKCLRAIVGGALRNYHSALANDNEYAVDASKRTLLRLRELFNKMKSIMKSEEWLYEISANLNEEIGCKEDVLNDFMKQYRTLQSGQGWEKDSTKVFKMTTLLKDICSWHQDVGTKESLEKCRLLVKGVVKKIRGNTYGSESHNELLELELLLSKLEKSTISSQANQAPYL